MSDVELFVAAERGDAARVSELFNEGASATAVDANAATPLHWAAYGNHKVVCELCLGHGADVNAGAADGRTPLHLAAMAGSEEAIRFLLASGADISARDRWEGFSPLHLAAAEGHYETVNLLVACGADVDDRDTRGRTPLCLAAENGHTDVVHVLLALGAGIDLADEQGQTPLLHALRGAQLEVAKGLLGMGADVNVRDKLRGQTPLHVAAENGATEMVELLLLNGADTSLRDQSGMTAEDAAVEAGQTAAVEILIGGPGEAGSADVVPGYGPAEWDRGADWGGGGAGGSREIDLDADPLPGEPAEPPDYGLDIPIGPEPVEPGPMEEPPIFRSRDLRTPGMPTLEPLDGARRSPEPDIEEPPQAKRSRRRGNEEWTTDGLEETSGRSHLEEDLEEPPQEEDEAAAPLPISWEETRGAYVGEAEAEDQAVEGMEPEPEEPAAPAQAEAAPPSRRVPWRLVGLTLVLLIIGALSQTPVLRPLIDQAREYFVSVRQYVPRVRIERRGAPEVKPPFVPPRRGAINDFTDILDERTRQALQQLIGSIEAVAKIEMSITVVQTAQPLSVQEYAQKFAETWKVVAEYSRRVLMMVALEEGGAAVVVTENLEDRLNEVRRDYVRDVHVVPLLRENAVNAAVLSGVNAIWDFLKRDAGGEEASAPRRPAIRRRPASRERPRPTVAYVGPVTVTIDSRPREARVVLDGGRREGETPFVVVLTGGAHEIHLSKPGYVGLRTTIVVRNHSKRFTFDLERVH